MLTNEKGLTLIEILAVIVIIGIISSIFIKGVIGQSDAAQAKLNETKMQKLKASLSTYRLEYGSYPSTLKGLIKPESKVKNSDKVFTQYAGEDDIKDIWGSEFIYRQEQSGRSYILQSYGADGVAGGEGADQDLTVKP